MLTFYATLISFSILALLTAGYWFYLLSRKKSTVLTNIMLLTLLAFCSIIIAIFSYDFIQLKRGHTVLSEGQCETAYIRGGTSVDTTEIKLNDQLYVVKSNEYADLPDHTYYCEIESLPLTKYVIESDFTE